MADKSTRQKNRVARNMVKNIVYTIETEVRLNNISRRNHNDIDVNNGPGPSTVNKRLRNEDFEDHQSMKIDYDVECLGNELPIMKDVSLNNLSESDDNIIHHSSDETGSDSEPEVIVDNNCCDTSTFLRKWTLENNITHTAVSQLLKWLNTQPNLSNIPLDARTLLKTPSKNCLRQMGDGSFHYFGIVVGIKKIVEKYQYKCTTFHLDFNIDGLPIHKSTKISFWPILCKVAEYKNEPPFAVAIYSGINKPPLVDFFTEFITELNHCSNNGLKINNYVINISIRSFCCDTPARAFIKNTKNHNAYYGCDKCLVKGIYLNHKMCFTDLKAPLRTDEHFLTGEYGEYIKGPSPLSELAGIGMVSRFPNDYMHSVCLGVMRKLLFLWRSGSRLFRFKIEKYSLLEEKIIGLKSYWPVEFNRKPRTLNDLEHWKATEFRQFLLYISPLLFDILPKHLFCNLMLLKFGLTILLSPTLNSDQYLNDYAKELLINFVKNSIQIYGKDFCVYNVHSVIHLADEAREYGSLNEINCFSFENYLSFLKRSLRKSNNSLQQAVNRIKEGRNMSKGSEITCTIGQPLNREGDNVNYYQKFMLKNIVFTLKRGNNCAFLKNGKIFLITAIFSSDGILVEGHYLKIIKPFLEYPTSSAVISLFEVSFNISECNIERTVHNIEDIKSKGILLKNSDGNYLIVEFPDERDGTGATSMAIISSSWVLEEDGCLYCNWPSYFRTDLLKDKAVQNHMPLIEDKCVKCPILIKFTTDDYTKAWSKFQRMEIESQTESEKEDAVGKRKSKKKIFDIYDSDDSEVGIPQVPLPKKVLTNLENINFQKYQTTSQSCGSSQRNTMCPKASTHTGKHFTQIPQSTIEPELDEVSMASTSGKHNLRSCSGCDENKKLLTEVLRQLKIMKEDTSYLIKLYIDNTEKQVSSGEVAKIDSFEELSKLNDDLSDKTTFAEWCCKLQYIGGKNEHETCRKILSTLITNDLAIKSNWTGRNEKNGFKDLKNVIQLLHVSVRKNPLAKNCTVINIETIIKAWLRTASDREGGRAKRVNASVTAQK